MRTKDWLGWASIFTGVLLLIGFAFTGDAHAQEATPPEEEVPPPGITVTISGTTSLRWQAPTQNVDGSDLTDLASYVIYFGRESRDYLDSLPVLDGQLTSFVVTIPLLDALDDQWYFAITAVNDDGDQSGYSNEILKTMDVTFSGTKVPVEPVLIEVEMNMQCTTDDEFWDCDVTWTTGP